jgi:ubiquinone biosynthesis protein UbiJ
MALKYDELGNIIGEDTLTLDEMRYRLAHSGQKNPPHGYEYAKPGRMPLRANGSDVPMLPEEVAKTLVPIPPPEPKAPYSTATNFPQAVADRLGISAIPQAIMAIGSGFGSEVAKGAGQKELSQAMQYYPSSRVANDVLAGLEEAPRAITGSHMGFGPMPETWVGGLGHIAPNDIRVLAKQNIERARELKAIPEDFRNAQYGVRRESALGGDTYGAALQRAADDLADFQARNQARRAEYATPMPGSVEVFGNLMPENAMYAVRPNKSGSQVIREVPTPLNPAYSITGESRLSEDLTDIVDMQQPRERDDKSYQHLDQFTNYVPGDFNKSAKDMFHEFVQPALASEFPGTDPSDYGRAVHAKYGVNANEWYKKQLEAFALTPEAKIHNEKAFKVAMSDPEIPKPFEFLRDVLIIPPSAQFEGKKAADDWVMNNLQNYLVEHLGTPGDPIPRLIAETGRVPIEEGRDRLLTHNQRIDDQVKDLRAKAGMPTAGTFEPELDRTRNLLGQNNMVIQMLQDKENELIAAHPGVRPQDIPGWKEARKEVVQATKRKDETAKKFDNLMMAQSFENYSDLELSIADEKRFTENLEPYFKERFPMLPTNKDIAFQMRVPGPYRELAKDIQNRLAVSGAPGISGIEGAKNLIKAADIGSHTVPKAVQIKAELMAQREKMGEQAAKLADQKLMDHTKKRMEAMPQDGTYGPATVVRITKDLGPEQIKSDISDITEWMDHCIGRGGSPDKKILSPKAKALGASNVPENQRYRSYIPAVASHLGNKVPVGSSGSTNQYMKDVIKGEADIVDFRDTATGVPFASLKLVVSRTHPGMYQFDEFYGYRDKEVTGPWAPSRNTDYTAEENNAYRQAIADWANDHQAQLKPATSDYLITYSKVYDTASNDHKSKLTNAFNAKKDEVNEVLYQMNKRFVSYPEFKEALDNFKASPPETIESLRGARDELSDLLREAEDPEATMGIDQMDDLRHQISVLDQRIAAMENRPPVGARAVVQVRPDWNRMVNDIREDTRTQLDTNDAAAMANAIEETQNLFTFSQQPHEFVAELERRADQFENNNENREEVARALRNVAMGYDSQIINDPVARTTPEAVNFLANDIVVRNAAFRDQTTATIVNAIEDQLLPSFQRFNPIIPGDRQELENQVRLFQTSPLDQDLGTRLESYIQGNPTYENRIRESVADFMIDQIQQHLGNRPQAAQVPAIVPERAGADSVAPLVRNALNALPNLRDNAFVTEIVAQQVIDLSGQVSFGQRPQDFVQQLRNRAQMLEETPGNGETNPDDNREAARQMRMLSNSLENRVQNPAAQAPVIGDAYETVQRAIQPLIEGEHITALEPIAEGIMGNMNGVYADLTGPQRLNIRQQIYDAMDRIRSNQDPTPLSDIIAMEMNRIRDNYGEEIEREVDGVLTSINDNYDIGQEPALFRDRVVRNADREHAANNLPMYDIYNHIAELISQTIRENNAIYDARRRAGNVVDEDEEGLVMDDDQLDDVAHSVIADYEHLPPDRLRQEAADMRNGMFDLPEFRALSPTQREQAQTEIAMRMEMHADMMDDAEEATNQAPPALPAPERTPEQNAINEALRHPRFWYNRYPDLPHDVVTGMIHRLNIQHAPPDFAGMRDYAAQGMRRTIFENLNPVQQRQAAAMIDDIANDYQNRIQRVDNQQLAQGQYNNATEAFNGLLAANNNFMLPTPEEGLNTLRALPQLLDRENLRPHFGTTRLSQRQRLELEQHINELIRQRTENPQLPPPEGHKRGGYIKKKMMNEGGKVEPSAPSSSIDEALQQPGLKHKFTGEDILKNYGDSVFESYDKSKARKRLEPIVLRQITSTTDSYDDGQHLMNRQSVPLGKADAPAAPTGQSFEDFQRQHMHRLRPEEVSRRGNTGIKNGGAVDIDQMRYELTRKR